MVAHVHDELQFSVSLIIANEVGKIADNQLKMQVHILILDVH